MIEKVVLGDVLTEVKTGIGADWAKYPVMGATRDGLAPAKERPGKNPQKYKPVVPGTVFYNPMRILIGSIAYVEEDDPPGITSPDYVVFVGKEKRIDSRWFYYWLRSPLGHRCIASHARGAVRERMLFNRLANAEVEIPDFDTQQKVSRVSFLIHRSLPGTRNGRAGNKRDKEHLMFDVFMVALGLGFFLVAVGYAHACERL
jgi:type I restriction enzyme S subunit